jgi:Spondin_N
MTPSLRQVSKIWQRYVPVASLQRIRTVESSANCHCFISRQRGVVSGLIPELTRLRKAVGTPSIGNVLFTKNATQQKLPNIIMPAGLTYMSSITRIAPSPDWFSCFSRFNAANTTTKTWYRSFALNTYPFDAGTERGDQYSPFNVAESPQRRISRFTEMNIRPTNVLVSEASNGRRRVLPVARWECKLV